MGNLKTLRLTVDAHAVDTAESQTVLRRAAEILVAGGLVAFPTETVYGLGANALDPVAVKRIFEAKRRPLWDPLIVHVASEEQLQRVVEEIPSKARLLMRTFWPGPLTLLLPKNRQLPEAVTAGRPRVGVRMPRHAVAQALIREAQVPIAAPSANSFGRTSPTRADFVLDDLDGRIDAVIDSGETSLGLESTVVDLCEDPPVLYRPGIVTLEQLQSVCGRVVRHREVEDAARQPESQPSPGTALRHYAPKARLILLDPEAVEDAVNLASSLEREGERVGIMLPEGLGKPEAPQMLVYQWGRWSDQEELARRLFAGLRELDSAGATVILCPLPAEEGVGRAILDRLRRAARK